MASRRQSKSSRARKRSKARVRTRAAWRDELAEQLADHRIDALAIGLAVFGLLSLLAMFSDLVGPIGRGVDTVAAHVAAAFRIPSITLFGPTNPFHWRARHSRAIVLRAGFPGPIEYFDPRQSAAPMSELSTDAVIRAMEVLQRRE